MPDARPPANATLAQAVARAYGTPSLVIDLDVVDRNIAKLQALCDRAGVANRPHIKTHKSVDLAKRQMAAGAKGITCQKLGEAEVMAAGGIDDILISYNLLGEEKMARLARLAESVTVAVCADNPVVVEHLQTAASQMTRPLRVLVECDTGRNRAGVVTAKEAVTLARTIEAKPGLTFEGLLLYPPEDGWPQTLAFFADTKAGLADAGLSPRIVSTGGTPNLENLGRLDEATEHRSGTFIFNDRIMLAAGAATMEELALHVIATVVSRAEDDRGILDAGSKTLTSDTGGLSGHGLIREYPDAQIAGFAEEHGMMDLSRSERRPEVGEVVSIVPNHVCVAVNMVDRLIAVKGQEIIGPMTVDARGRLI
ncbi:MAG: D-TA family PLP-dependent enzyme [Devosia sp.]